MDIQCGLQNLPLYPLATPLLHVESAVEAG